MSPPPHCTHDHHIPLEEGKTPLYEPLRPLNEEKMKALKEYLEVNEKWGLIRASTSPAGVPIHFVKKKDRGLRLCVDYRQLNEITIKDWTPLPLIGESLNQLSTTTISPNSISESPTITSKSQQETNGKQPSESSTDYMSTASYLSG